MRYWFLCARLTIKKSLQVVEFDQLHNNQPICESFGKQEDSLANHPLKHINFGNRVNKTAKTSGAKRFAHMLVETGHQSPVIWE